MNWKFVIAIPGVELPRRVEAGSTAALPPDDPDYDAIAKSEPGVSEFLSRFSTAFGRQLRPTIIAREKTADLITAEDLSAFRNTIALAAIVEARRQRDRTQWSSGPFFSEVFDFSPVAPRDAQFVDIQSPFSRGIHDIEEFAGQPSPIVPYPKNMRCEFDEGLLEALLRLWASKATRRLVRRRTLLRSVEMACHALRAPYSNLESLQDWGITTSLWVSAFEIIACPDSGDVKFPHVSSMIKRVPWASRSLRKPAVRAIDRPGLTTRPVQVYGRLYRVRNSFLHGDRLPAGSIEPHRHPTWGHLSIQVPLLFRSVLLLNCQNLNLWHFPTEVPWVRMMSKGPQQKAAIKAAHAFRTQMDYEKALGATEGDFF